LATEKLALGALSFSNAYKQSNMGKNPINLDGVLSLNN
jgi:hypothetical protein